MKDMEKVGAIYKTKNYSMFRKLLGNRGVEEKRLNKLRRSIEKKGYYPVPIIVNENMEIIDGQHRVEIAREMDLPILFYCDKWAGIKECKILNSERTSWRTTDYIFCEAEIGNVEYKYIQSLFTAFNSKFTDTVILNAIRQSKSGASRKGMNREYVIDGKYRCSKEEYENANKLLEELVPYGECLSRGKVKQKASYLFALEFILKYCRVDKSRLFQVLNEASSFHKVANVEQAIDEIDKLYNFRLGSKNKVYLNHEYEVWMNTK